MKENVKVLECDIPFENKSVDFLFGNENSNTFFHNPWLTGVIEVFVYFGIGLIKRCRKSCRKGLSARKKMVAPPLSAAFGTMPLWLLRFLRKVHSAFDDVRSF